MDRKRRRQESKVNSIIAEDINMQQIYKKYIGQFPKLKKLRDYFFDFHDFMIKCCDDDCDVNIQNDLINKLEIEYNLNKRIFSNALEFKEQLLEIKNDFNNYFNQMSNTTYISFEDIEDDKLVLYNILEEYFEVLKTHVTNKTERRFLKVVMLDINRKIDISKNFKLFDNSFSNFSLEFLETNIFIRDSICSPESVITNRALEPIYMSLLAYCKLLNTFLYSLN